MSVATVSPVLLVEGLTKHFPLERQLFERLRDWWKGRPGPLLTALKDVSFEVNPQETVGLLGESGSGKSTLARVLMGLYHSDRGRASLLGQDLFSKDRSIRKENLKRMQMVFQPI